MSQNQTIQTPQDYVNYTFNIQARGIAEVSGELIGLSNTVTNILGQIAFKTSEFLSHTETLAIGAGAAVGATFVKATEDAIRFEQQVANVKAIGGEAVDANLIGSKAMEYSNKFGMAVSQMTEGLEALARAGITTTSVMSGVLEEGVKLSKLEGIDLEESINDLISTTNLLSQEDVDMNAPEYAEMLKQMNQHIVSTSESAPINAQNIIQTLQHVGGYASASGMDQDDLFAVIAQLGARGTKGEMAGTALRAFIAAGQKDTAQRALARIGLNVSDLWNDNGETMLSISEMKDVIDEALEARGYSKQEKLEFYSDFAGYKQANQIMKIDTSEVQKYRDSIEHAWDLGKKLDTILGTVKGNLDRIWQITQNFMTKVGSKMLTIAGAILTPVRMALELFTKIPFADTGTALLMMFVGLRTGLALFNKLYPALGGFISRSREGKEYAHGIRGEWERTVDQLKLGKEILGNWRNPRELTKIHYREQGLSAEDKAIIEDRIAGQMYMDKEMFRIHGLTWDELDKPIKNMIIAEFKQTDEFDRNYQEYIRRTREKAAEATSEPIIITDFENTSDLQAINKYVQYIFNLLEGQETSSTEGRTSGEGASVSGGNRERNRRTRELHDLGEGILNNRSQYGDYNWRSSVEGLRDPVESFNLDDLYELQNKINQDIERKIRDYTAFSSTNLNETGKARVRKSLTRTAMTPFGIAFSTYANTSDIRRFLETGERRSSTGQLFTEEQLAAVAEAIGVNFGSHTPDANLIRQKYLEKKNEDPELLDKISNATQRVWHEKQSTRTDVSFFPTQALQTHQDVADKLMQLVGVNSINEVQAYFSSNNFDESKLEEATKIMADNRAFMDDVIEAEIKYMYENLARVQNTIVNEEQRQNSRRRHQSMGEENIDVLTAKYDKLKQNYYLTPDDFYMIGDPYSTEWRLNSLQYRDWLHVGHNKYTGGTLGSSEGNGLVYMNPGAIKYHTDMYPELYGTDYGTALLENLVHEMTHTLADHSIRENETYKAFTGKGIDDFSVDEAILGYTDGFVAEFEANYVAVKTLERLGLEASQKAQMRMARFQQEIDSRGLENSYDLELLDSLVDTFINNRTMLSDYIQTLSTQFDMVSADTNTAEISNSLRTVTSALQNTTKSTTFYNGKPISSSIDVDKVISDIAIDILSLNPEGAGENKDIIKNAIISKYAPILGTHDSQVAYEYALTATTEDAINNFKKTILNNFNANDYIKPELNPDFVGEDNDDILDRWKNQYIKKYLSELEQSDIQDRHFFLYDNKEHVKAYNALLHSKSGLLKGYSEEGKFGYCEVNNVEFLNNEGLWETKVINIKNAIFNLNDFFAQTAGSFANQVLFHGGELNTNPYGFGQFNLRSLTYDEDTAMHHSHRKDRYMQKIYIPADVPLLTPTYRMLGHSWYGHEQEATIGLAQPYLEKERKPKEDKDGVKKAEIILLGPNEQSQFLTSIGLRSFKSEGENRYDKLNKQEIIEKIVEEALKMEEAGEFVNIDYMSDEHQEIIDYIADGLIDPILIFQNIWSRMGQNRDMNAYVRGAGRNHRLHDFADHLQGLKDTGLADFDSESRVSELIQVLGLAMWQSKGLPFPMAGVRFGRTLDLSHIFGDNIGMLPGVSSVGYEGISSYNTLRNELIVPLMPKGTAGYPNPEPYDLMEVMSYVQDARNEYALAPNMYYIELERLKDAWYDEYGELTDIVKILMLTAEQVQALDLPLFADGDYKLPLAWTLPKSYDTFGSLEYLIENNEDLYLGRQIEATFNTMLKRIVEIIDKEGKKYYYVQSIKHPDSDYIPPYERQEHLGRQLARASAIDTNYWDVDDEVYNIPIKDAVIESLQELIQESNGQSIQTADIFNKTYEKIKFMLDKYDDTYDISDMITDAIAELPLYITQEMMNNPLDTSVYKINKDDYSNSLFFLLSDIFERNFTYDNIYADIVSPNNIQKYILSMLVGKTYDDFDSPFQTKYIPKLDDDMYYMFTATNEYGTHISDDYLQIQQNYRRHGGIIDLWDATNKYDKSNPINDFLLGNIDDTLLSDFDNADYKNFYIWATNLKDRLKSHNKINGNEIEDITTLSELVYYFLEDMQNTYHDVEKMSNNTRLFTSGTLNTVNNVGATQGILSGYYTEEDAINEQKDNEYIIEVLTPYGTQGIMTENNFILPPDMPYIELGRDEETKTAKILILTNDLLKKILINPVFVESFKQSKQANVQQFESNKNANAQAYISYYEQENEALEEQNELLTEAYNAQLKLQAIVYENQKAYIDWYKSFNKSLEAQNKLLYEEHGRQQAINDRARKNAQDNEDFLNMLHNWAQSNIEDGTAKENNRIKNRIANARYKVEKNVDDSLLKKIVLQGLDYADIGYSKFSRFTDTVSKESQERTADNTVLGDLGHSIGEKTESIRNFNNILTQLSNIFPVLTPAVMALNTALDFTTALSEGLTTVQYFLAAAHGDAAAASLLEAEAESGNTAAKWLGVIANWAETGSETERTIATWVLIGAESIATAVELARSFIIENIMILGPIAAAVAVAVGALWLSEQNHAKALKKATEEQEKAHKELSASYITYQNLHNARKNETDAMKRQQLARKESIALYDLEAKRIEHINAINKKSELRSDVIWGEYGLRASLQKMGLGIIAGGDFESQYEQYEGSTGEIRRIKENSIGTIASPYQSEVGAWYDAHAKQLGQIEAFAPELQELYTKESQLIEKYGSKDAARDSKEFKEAVQEFADATGLNKETAERYLDYLQTEANVENARKVMQAEVDMITSQATANAMKELYGDETGMGDLDTVQDSMVYATADEIFKEAYNDLYWKMLMEWLSAIYYGITLNWDESGKHARAAGAYQEGMNELVRHQNEIVQEGVDVAKEDQRKDYGEGSYAYDYGDTPFSGAVASSAAMEQDYAIEETSRSDDYYNASKMNGEAAAEGFRDGLDQHSPGKIARMMSTEMDFTHQAIQDGSSYILNSLISLPDRTIGRIKNAKEWTGNKVHNALTKGRSAVFDDAIGALNAATKDVHIDGSITEVHIHQVNINTEDDPEKIKTSLMNLIVEMKEQVVPRQVSRTIGQSAEVDQTNNNNQVEGTDNTQNNQNSSQQNNNQNPTI